MFKRTRVVAVNGGFVAQFRKNICCSWFSYDKGREGSYYYRLEYIIKYCLHDSVEAAKATLLLMTPVVVK